jgi:hypothetical protein
VDFYRECLRETRSQAAARLSLNLSSISQPVLRRLVDARGSGVDNTTVLKGDVVDEATKLKEQIDGIRPALNSHLGSQEACH